MSGITPVAPYALLDSTTMTGTTYKTAIDGNSVAASRIVNRFAPHAQASPNMTVRLEAGSIFNGTTLTEVAAQNTATIVAPVAYSRIDRVVIDNTTGAVSMVTGTEAVSPAVPAIPSGKSPVAQIALTTSTTSISNAVITDERNFGGMASSGTGARTSIASASTCNIGGLTSHNALITGTTTIAAFGSSAMTTSPIYLLEFAGSLTLTNSAALLLPGSADIVTAAGDTAEAEYLGSGNWRVRAYVRSDGSAITPFTSSTTGLVPAPAPGDAAAGKVLSASGSFVLPSSGLRPLAFLDASTSSTMDFTSYIDSTYDIYQFELINIVPSINGATLYARTSSDGGATFAAGSGDYSYGYAYSSGNASGGGSSTANALIVGSGQTTNPSYTPTSGSLKMYAPASAYIKGFRIDTIGTDATPHLWSISGQTTRNSTSIINAVRFFMSSGNIVSGRIIMYGMKSS